VTWIKPSFLWMMYRCGWGKKAGQETVLPWKSPPYRSLQLGLSGEAVRRYADEWIVSINDVPSLAHEIHQLVSSGDLDSAARRLPHERPYPCEEDLLRPLQG
jgi:uncharacterized protein DUF4291